MKKLFLPLLVVVALIGCGDCRHAPAKLKYGETVVVPIDGKLSIFESCNGTIKGFDTGLGRHYIVDVVCQQGIHSERQGELIIGAKPLEDLNESK